MSDRVCPTCHAPNGAEATRCWRCRSELVDATAAGPRRPTAAVVALAVCAVLVLAAGAWGLATLQRAEHAESDAAATQTNLTNAQANLSQLEGQLQATQHQLATVTQERDQATQSRADAEANAQQLSQQLSQAQEQLDAALSNNQAAGACISALANNFADLVHVSDLQTQNYNRLATGSTWADAYIKRNQLLSDAIQDYYAAYAAALNGDYVKANNKATAGYDASGQANQQLNVMSREISAADAINAEIGQELNTLASAFASTAAICGVPAPSVPPGGQTG